MKRRWLLVSVFVLAGGCWPQVHANSPTVTSVDPPPGTVGALTQITVRFSEPVNGVSFSDLLVNDIPATGLSGVASTYAFAVEQPPYGPVQISWDPGASITDFGLPPNLFNPTGPGATWQYNLVDTTPPTVASLNPLAGVTVKSLTQVEVKFSETVTGVDASDLLINGSPATNVSGPLAGPYVFRFPPAAPGTVQLAWAAGANIRDQAAAPNNFAGGSWNCTVDPSFLAAPVRINEFLTSYSGTTGLADEEGELQDWIELYNSGTNTVSLLVLQRSLRALHSKQPVAHRAESAAHAIFPRSHGQRSEPAPRGAALSRQHRCADVQSTRRPGRARIQPDHDRPRGNEKGSQMTNGIKIT